MPIYGTSFLDGEDQTYAGVKEVERVFIDRKSPQNHRCHGKAIL